MKIITDLKTLREKSKEIPARPEIYYRLIKDLEQALTESPQEGVGLSAIQIGVPLRVAIIRSEGLHLDLFNTKIIKGSELKIFKGEGCLSFPNKYVDTYRMNKITIKNGDDKIYELEGLESVIVAHEIDHWNSVLIIDREIKEQGGI